MKDAGLLVALYTLGLINNIEPSHLKPDPFQDIPHGWESEDCLLLDVVVPEGVAEAVKEDDDFVPCKQCHHMISNNGEIDKII